MQKFGKMTIRIPVLADESSFAIKGLFLEAADSRGTGFIPDL